MHAHRDGPSHAVVDSPQSVVPVIDVSHDLEIGQCATHAQLLVAARFASLRSASLAFDWWDGLGDHTAMIGYAGAAVFGLVTAPDLVLPAERGGGRHRLRHSRSPLRK
ncbi:hypothetical protein [Bradyrhizobium liaoningense]|uniref:hypothetical protein n=1 Tax=Bradyrhizobium liaoningense TaxID=43992 RepID=UPI001BA8ED54|nr:hypothetical protein [Bradyrhizobium liaoningense]MBR0855278.1 hypothetical protein [Bradyrhizobium liaoningense]